MVRELLRTFLKVTVLMKDKAKLYKAKLLLPKMTKSLLMATKPLPLKRFAHLQMLLLKLILLRTSPEVRSQTLKTRTPRIPTFLVLEARPEDPTATVGDLGSESFRAEKL
jgi:hypothetical protein